MTTPPPEEEPDEDGSPEYSLSLPLNQGEDDPEVKRKMQDTRFGLPCLKHRDCIEK
jgi:hypothetical protein